MLKLCKRKIYFISRLILGLALIYIYCGYLIYYITQIQCTWPELSDQIEEVVPLHAVILADIHIMSKHNRHWFSKFLEGWQMQQAFQTAMVLHRPEVVFILGDIFEEGERCSEKEFEAYVQRFHEMFKINKETVLYTLAGNHDIGFHYRIKPQIVNRFESKMDAPPVQLVSIRGNHFILINSLAMEGDGCALCARAVKEIDGIADILKCSKGSELCKGNTSLDQYSRPIILQHFPLYRESDSLCTDYDSAPLPDKSYLFEERLDCLSKESTEYIVDSLHPRAAFGGHTHQSCVTRHSFVPTQDHKIEFVEYTVPSFSWRKRLDPKYYLLTITPNDLEVTKCGMHHEWTMYVTALLMFLALIGYLIYCSKSATTLRYKYLRHQSNYLHLQCKCDARHVFGKTSPAANYSVRVQGEQQGQTMWSTW